MPRMSEQPLTRAVLASVLADFHRDVIAQDFKLVFERLDRMDRRFDDIDAHFDDVYHRFERLEQEYHLLTAGLKAVEERLDRVDERLELVERRVDDAVGRADELALRFEGTENRLGQLAMQVLELRTRVGRVEERLEELIALEEKYPVRAEVQDLKGRVELLHEAIHRLEERLKA